MLALRGKKRPGPSPTNDSLALDLAPAPEAGRRAVHTLECGWSSVRQRSTYTTRAVLTSEWLRYSISHHEDGEAAENRSLAFSGPGGERARIHCRGAEPIHRNRRPLFATIANPVFCRRRRGPNVPRA